MPQRIAVAFLFCVVLALPFSSRAHVGTSSVDFEITTLTSCFDDADKILSCSTPPIRSLLEGRSGNDVMHLLEERVSTKCHRFGHIVGREVYARSGDVEAAINECGYTCGGACTHGIVGAAFLEALDIEPSSDVDLHVSIDLICREGKALCKTATMCHGIGHMAFQIYNEFEPALSVCKDIAWGLRENDCYWGVFMEHADEVSSHNVLRGSERKREYSVSNILFPCTTVDAEYREACYRYQPRIQSQIFDTIGVVGEERRDMLRRLACETLLTSSDRSACFKGLGRHFMDAAVYDPHGVQERCGALERFQDRISCTKGVVLSLAAYDHLPQVAEYCSSTSGWRERVACWLFAIAARIFVLTQ